jgi:ATP-dependent Clp protease protease subunit
LQKHTNQDLDRIKHDIQRDYFLSSEESVAYGLIDEVLVRDKR